MLSMKPIPEIRMLCSPPTSDRISSKVYPLLSIKVWSKFIVIQNPKTKSFSGNFKRLPNYCILNTLESESSVTSSKLKAKS